MTPESPDACPQCGHKLPGGEECSYCANRKIFPLVQREVFLLLVLTVVALGAYFGTLAFAKAYDGMKAGYALSWYQEGERFLQAGRPDQAVAAFRKATVNDRGQRHYMLALAHALETDGRDNEALQLLLQMRDTAPEDPEINVELGRIAMRQKNLQEVVRYDHNALYGIWTGDDIDLRRIQVRRELIEFLIAQHARDQALAEILALAAHLNNTPASHLELGALFARAGDPQRALLHFRSVLHEEPRNAEGLQGAGKAAFAIGDYKQAYRLLSEAAALDPDSKNMLSVAGLVVDNDPLQPRLAGQERDRRVLADFDHAAQHLQDCLAQQTTTASNAQLIQAQGKLAAFHSSLTAARLRSNPNVLFDALELIYEAEIATAKSCGPPQGIDLALSLIAQKSRRLEP